MGNVNLIVCCFSLLGFICKAGATTPTVQASNLTASNITCVSVNLNFTAGDGAARIIIGRKGSLVNVDPSDYSSYVPNNKFGAPGSAHLGSGNYVLYNSGTSNFAFIDSLEPNTTYHFAIYEHDNNGNNVQYLTTNPSRIAITTKGINFGFNITVIDSCQDHNLYQFTNTTNSSIPGLSYSWDFGDGKTATGFDASHSYTVSGLKQVKLTASPSMGCPNSFIRNVKIYQKKNAIISMNDSNQCLYGNSFSNNLQPIVSPGVVQSFTYKWYFGDGDSSEFPKFKNKVYKQAGQYNMKLIITIRDINNGITGCYDTLYIPVEVFPSPSSSAYVSDTFVCEKNNLFNFDNKDLTLTSYKWYFGDSDSSLIRNPSHSYKDTGTYRVIHLATSPLGCYGADTVMVHVGPNQDATFTGLDTFYCSNALPVSVFPKISGGKFIGNGMIGDKFYPNIAPNPTVIQYVLGSQYCDDTASVTIRIQAAPVVNLGKDSAICNISSYTLDAVIPGTYLWNDESTAQTRTVYATGIYSVKVSQGKCSDQDSVDIVFATYPVINLGGDTVICKGGAVFLNASNPRSRYTWNNGASDSGIYAYTTGLYKVTVTNPCGTTQDSVYVTVQGDYCDLFMPNAFSPGNDLVNNVYYPRGRNISITSFAIYDRWGQKVFETHEDNVGWDGTNMGAMCPQDVYIWHLEYTTRVGKFIKKNNAAGHMTLIR